MADESASLSVVAFPFELLDQVARVRPLDVPGCYLLANGSAAYVGESVNVQNRLGQHQIDPAKNFATEAFVITSASGCGLDKAVALLLQQHLTAAIEAAGLVSLAIGRKPQAIGLPLWREAPWSASQRMPAACCSMPAAGRWIPTIPPFCCRPPWTCHSRLLRIQPRPGMTAQ